MVAINISVMIATGVSTMQTTWRWCVDFSGRAFYWSDISSTFVPRHIWEMQSPAHSVERDMQQLVVYHIILSEDHVQMQSISIARQSMRSFENVIPTEQSLWSKSDGGAKTMLSIKLPKMLTIEDHGFAIFVNEILPRHKLSISTSIRLLTSRICITVPIPTGSAIKSSRLWLHFSITWKVNHVAI